MKKLLVLLFIIFLFSCEKDSRCWQCITTIVTTCGGYASDESKIIVDKCDISENDIREYERSSTVTVTTTTMGITCTARSSCKCEKQ